STLTLMAKVRVHELARAHDMSSQDVLDKLRAAGIAIEAVETTEVGHGIELARAAYKQGHRRFLAVGGDGTANEVASGLLGSATALGVVPAGSGNGLARTLRVPIDADRALRELSSAVTLRMDVGRVNGQPFLNVAGAGFDAAVGEAFHERALRGGRRGVMNYARIAFAMSWTYRRGGFALQAGEHRFEGQAWLVAFVNGRQYGGAAVIAPGARLDDGLLDVVVVEEAGPLEILAAAPRLYFGGLEDFRRYHRMPASQAVLTGPAPFPHHCDGEPRAAATKLEVTIEPRALNVLVPKATAEDPTGPFGQGRR
ncbi:MAG: translation initiation factor IF-2 N-terminal domain-containing protein, partial [Sphingomicrobium sp.]